MTRKKGKLLTFLWSLIPGAGEMYLGFFKQGVSIMGIFCILLGISGFLDMAFLTFLSPIVWFYSFFHANNLVSLPDDEFYALEDDYLIHWNDISKNKETLKKYRKVLAAVLIFFGLSILWNSFSHLLFRYILPSLYLTDEAVNLIRYIAASIPQGVVAIGIIVIGIIMIKGKYEDLKNDDTYIPSPPYLEDKNSK